MNHRKFFIVLFCVALFFMLSPIEMNAQCAMCKQSAESSLKNPNSVARGLNSGILYLMAVPYLAIMFIFRKQIYTLFKMFRARFSRAEKIN
jgi:hypothetical protein